MKLSLYTWNYTILYKYIFPKILIINECIKFNTDKWKAYFFFFSTIFRILENSKPRIIDAFLSTRAPIYRLQRFNKKKKVAADTIASTQRRENNLFRNTSTRRSFNQMQDARTREKDTVANTKVQRNVSHLQS